MENVSDNVKPAVKFLHKMSTAKARVKSYRCTCKLSLYCCHKATQYDEERLLKFCSISYIKTHTKHTPHCRYNAKQ